MKIEIQDHKIRLTSAHGRSLIIYMSAIDGTEIISFSISDGRIEAGGNLPAVEFSSRETILRHIGNRIEQIR